ncbi:hypothetical protein HaLaN_08185 [Haematococcus lacustris]|uniref:Uncharacterized protein n=1 Tax=Haematococcus lacustris TaxID=44745 RepID=A0A699ZAI9_HAELA|nr:hypothetical protein HaLaN_08185 [Haematococcus lacustris]
MQAGRWLCHKQPAQNSKVAGAVTYLASSACIIFASAPGPAEPGSSWAGCPQSPESPPHGPWHLRQHTGHPQPPAKPPPPQPPAEPRVCRGGEALQSELGSKGALHKASDPGSILPAQSAWPAGLNSRPAPTEQCLHCRSKGPAASRGKGPGLRRVCWGCLSGQV